MRHGVRSAKLGRNHNHQIALRRNLAFALIQSGRITTTLAKAKMVQPVVEQLITAAKKGAVLEGMDRQRVIVNLTSFFTSGQNQRTFKEVSKAERKQRRQDRREGKKVASLVNLRPVEKLMQEIAPAYAERNGGYTRIQKLGNRLGDNAQMAILSLV